MSVCECVSVCMVVCTSNYGSTKYRRPSSNIDSESTRQRAHLYIVFLRECLPFIIASRVFSRRRGSSFRGEHLIATINTNFKNLWLFDGHFPVTWNVPNCKRMIEACRDQFLKIIPVKSCNVGSLADVFCWHCELLIVESQANHTGGISAKLRRATSSPCSIGGTFLRNNFPRLILQSWLIQPSFHSHSNKNGEFTSFQM